MQTRRCRERGVEDRQAAARAVDVRGQPRHVREVDAVAGRLVDLDVRACRSPARTRTSAGSRSTAAPRASCTRTQPPESCAGSRAAVAGVVVPCRAARSAASRASGATAVTLP